MTIFSTSSSVINSLLILHQFKDGIDVAMYYEDPGFRDLSSHMAIFRSYVRLAHEIGAKLVVEQGYPLWSYLDMDALNHYIEIDYPSKYNSVYAWDLLAVGMGCCGRGCHRL